MRTSKRCSSRRPSTRSCPARRRTIAKPRRRSSRSASRTSWADERPRSVQRGASEIRKRMTLDGNYRGFEVATEDPGIAVVTMNEPDRLNGQTGPMKRDLTEFFFSAQMDDGIRVVVITGSGRAFSAGDGMTGRRRDYEDREKLARNIPRDRRNPLAPAPR